MTPHELHAAAVAQAAGPRSDAELSPLAVFMVDRRARWMLGDADLIDAPGFSVGASGVARAVIALHTMRSTQRFAAACEEYSL